MPKKRLDEAGLQDSFEKLLEDSFGEGDGSRAVPFFEQVLAQREHEDYDPPHYDQEVR